MHSSLISYFIFTKIIISLQPDMTKQPERNNKENKAQYKNKMDSETDFSSDSDSNYDEFANEIPFVGNIVQSFQFEPVFTVTEMQAEKYLAGSS